MDVRGHAPENLTPQKHGGKLVLGGCQLEKNCHVSLRRALSPHGAQPVLVYHLETPELGIAKRLTVGAGSRWLVHAHLPPSLIHTTAAMTLCMDSHPAIHANTRV